MRELGCGDALVVAMQPSLGTCGVHMGLLLGFVISAGGQKEALRDSNEVDTPPRNNGK